MTPLAKRLPRELRRNIGKYLGIFLLMCGSIALTSGFLLAAHSIGCLIDDMRDDYTIEDGRVTTSFEATDEQLKAAEDAASDVGGVTLYKNFSIDAIIKKTAGDDGTKRTLRTYAHRTKVDIASYCEGKEPKTDDEVAIDRVFATNNDLAVDDKVELEGRTYTICGIMTQPDSQALFLNNSDFTVNTSRTAWPRSPMPALPRLRMPAAHPPTPTPLPLPIAISPPRIASMGSRIWWRRSPMPMHAWMTSSTPIPTRALATRATT